jgi:TrmH family RNA methyltransferase
VDFKCRTNPAGTSVRCHLCEAKPYFTSFQGWIRIAFYISLIKLQTYGMKIVPVEGFHAVKHALRFGAEFTEILAVNDDYLKLARSLAPDIESRLTGTKIVSESEFRRSFTNMHPTGIAGLAQRPVYENVLRGLKRPAIFLENPRRMGNVGAVIRVAAATNAGAVITSGEADPWHPEAIRGSAGLHFAQPVFKVDSFKSLSKPIIAFDPDGQAFQPDKMPSNAILAFGTERDGLTTELKASADQIVSLPMRHGVSSLNLATSVAAAMYLISRARP